MAENNERTLQLRVEQLRIDGGTQPRVELDSGHVAELAEVLRNGGEFRENVKAVFDGSHYWLWEGFHRRFAFVQAKIKTVWVEVRNGTVRDARLLAVGTNSDHGLKRTTADKRHAIRMLLEDPEWVKWSDREIAKHCRVSHPLVADVRKEIKIEKERQRQRDEAAKAAEQKGASGISTRQTSPPASPPPPPADRTFTRNGTTSTMRTSKINENRNSNIRPVVKETEPELLTEIQKKKKRSRIKYIKQCKQSGDELEDALEGIRQDWDKVQVEEE